MYRIRIYVCFFYDIFICLSACMPVCVCVVPFAVCIFMQAHKVARS